jgi:hypothetical protein
LELTGTAEDIVRKWERDDFKRLIDVACRGVKAPLLPASGMCTHRRAKVKRKLVPRTPIAPQPVDMTNFANGIPTSIGGRFVDVSSRSKHNAETILTERYGDNFCARPLTRHASRSGMPCPPSPVRRTFAKAFRSKPLTSIDTRALATAYLDVDRPSSLPPPKYTKFIKSGTS